MCFAEGHNAVTPVRLKNTIPRSQVKHPTTGTLRSLLFDVCLVGFVCLFFVGGWVFKIQQITKSKDGLHLYVAL